MEFQGRDGRQAGISAITPAKTRTRLHRVR